MHAITDIPQHVPLILQPEKEPGENSKEQIKFSFHAKPS